MQWPGIIHLGPAAEATAAAFLVDGDRTGEFRFAHALVRSAVAAQLSGADQRRLHLAAADAIEAFYAGQLRPYRAELARHLVLGSLPGDRLRAAQACQTAGDVAMEDFAFEEAARLYAEALSVGHDELAEADRDRIELDLAAARYRGGDLPGWHEAVTGTARRAERRGDAWLLARAILVMEATGEPAWDGELSRLCEQALSDPALRGELPAGLRARVLARHAQALTYRGDHERAARISRDALEAAERAGDPAVLVDALQARQLACSAPEGHAERAALADRMLAVAVQTRNPWVEMWGRLWRIDTLFESGQLAIIARELADLAACAERVRGPVAQWHLLQCSAGLAFAEGRYREAIRQAGQAFGVISEMGHPAAFGSYASFLGQAGLYVGSEASGAAELMAGLPERLAPGTADRASNLVSVFPALSMTMLALERGDRARAVAAYEQAGPVRSWDPVPALRLPCWALGLTAATGLGRTGDLTYLAGRLEPFRGRHVASGAGAGPFGGPVELRLGQAAAAGGDVTAAIADLETAVAVSNEIGAAGLAVESEVELAAALLLRGERTDRDRARTLLAEADRGTARLEMAPLAERIANLRRHLSGGPAAPLLSPREQEVAGLVGQGLTNRQIAAALVVSERTAENHVQHILVKLGFSNRSQIAAWTMSTAMSNSHDGGTAELP